MRTTGSKPSLEERRRGEIALNKFAEYAEKQQAQRSAQYLPSDSGYETASAAPIPEDHAELDFLNQLDLTDAPKLIQLKKSLLGTGKQPDHNIQVLASILETRIDEGHDKTLFNLGLEDGGDSMSFDLLNKTDIQYYAASIWKEQKQRLK
ncbi:hypothetical protein BO79DRAFT_254654 [Aspergillus costaricaensis CBS 115574]|uniref:Uncharacterized protein n=1 Tax=Aspergillus costaricaensis CBS 115574 TaxID=1448317 RepID=A0ACD1IHM7_9EURO|nr:hypothetical protein BO79DRAFT_254654 [Aspergillus costaricaensis CBS 115574]RAK89262.1 hypothetical protein BO79DRAFT_254654 [Aspergillus costaricaensis CBS 115574]